MNVGRLIVVASLALTGCASINIPTMNSVLPTNAKLDAKFEGDANFEKFVSANKNQAIPVNERLEVLSYVVNPSPVANDEGYNTLIDEYEYKLAQLGCSADVFGNKSLNTGISVLKAKDGKWCLTQTKTAGDNYLIKISRTTKGLHFMYATVTHPRRDDIAQHTVGMKGITANGVTLYKTRWATVAQRGGSFHLMPTSVYNLYRQKIEQAKRQEAEARKKGGSLKERVDILDDL